MSIQVFISYSRPSFAYAQLLHDRLEARLNCRIFMDLASIEPGVDFVRAIEQAESSCSVVIVLITREWLALDPTRGMRPVDVPENWMRREVATALRQKTRILPVLLGNIAMPAETDLPEDISALARFQAMSIRDTEFSHDVEQLILLLEEEIGRDLIGSTKAIQPARFVADVIYYFPRFLKLIVMPKRVVGAYTANRQEELARSMAFLVISLSIFTAFSVPLFIDEERMMVLLLVQFLLHGILAFGSSAILQLSWRLAGGTARFSRYLSINSYYLGVSSVLGICLVAAALGVVKVFDPHILELLRKAAAGDLAPLLASEPGNSVPLRAAFWIVVIGNGLLLFWTYGFWGTYREINNATRSQSLLAFCTSCVLFIPVGVFFILMQEGLFNLVR